MKKKYYFLFLLSTYIVRCSFLLAVLVQVNFLLAAKPSTEALKASKAKPKICWAFDYWPPYHAFNQNENSLEPEGVVVDWVKEVISEYNKGAAVKLALEYRQRPWKRAQHEVKKGSCDFLVTAITKVRKKYSKETEQPLFYLENKIFKAVESVAKDEQKRLAIKRWEGLWQKEKNSSKMLTLIAKQKILVGVTFLGDGWWKENLGEIPTHHVNQPRLVFKALFEKRADFAITSPQEANYMLRNETKKQQAKIVDTQIVVESTPMHFMVSKQSPYFGAVTKINTAIIALRNLGKLKGESIGTVK
jgi:ABC-type amino acid transport substrate-binding protein